MYKVKSCVIIIGYNRIDKIRTLLESLRSLKFEQINYYIDGPRDDELDARKVNEVRNIIENSALNSSSVNIYAQSYNMGCKAHVKYALDHVFNKFEKVIVIEDDCLPVPAFFKYCDDRLEKYKNIDTIGTINGFNAAGDYHNKQSDVLTRMFNTWGWATWRRFATKVDYDFSDWLKMTEYDKVLWLQKKIGGAWTDPWRIVFWKNIFNAMSYNKLDSWGNAWVYMQLKLNARTVVPSVNYIRNIGFDGEAAHTSDSRYWAPNVKSFDRYYENSSTSLDALSIDKKYEKYYVWPMWKIGNIQKYGYYKYLFKTLLKAKCGLVS